MLTRITRRVGLFVHFHIKYIVQDSATPDLAQRSGAASPPLVVFYLAEDMYRLPNT